MLGILSNAHWPFVYFLWRNIYSNSLPISKLTFLLLSCFFFSFPFATWILCGNVLMSRPLQTPKHLDQDSYHQLRRRTEGSHHTSVSVNGDTAGPREWSQWTWWYLSGVLTSPPKSESCCSASTEHNACSCSQTTLGDGGLSTVKRKEWL